MFALLEQSQSILFRQGQLLSNTLSPIIRWVSVKEMYLMLIHNPNFTIWISWWKKPETDFDASHGVPLYETVEVAKILEHLEEAKDFHSIKREFFREKIDGILIHDISSIPRGKNYGDRLCADDEVLEMMEAMNVSIPKQQGAPRDLLIHFTIVIMYEIFDRMKSLPGILWRLMMIRYGNRSPTLWYTIYEIDEYKESVFLYDRMLYL